MQSPGQEARRLRARDAGPQPRRRGAQPAEDVSEVSLQLSNAIGAAVGERSLREDPHPFVRVELGSIGGELLRVKARVSAAEVAEGIPLVDPAVVPQDDDVAAQVAQKMPEELAGLSVGDVLLRVQPVVQAEAPPTWAHRYPGDHRDLVAAVEIEMVAPVDPMHQPRNVAALESHLEALLDDLGASLCRPEVRPIPVGNRALQQDPDKAALLGGGQLPGASWRHPQSPSSA